MNKITVDEIRKEIFKYADIRYNNYSEHKSFHIDKICHAIESLLHKYQKNPNPLLVRQDESWDGPASSSSRKRKRAVQDELEREKAGSKPDMSICVVCGGNKSLGFGACEAASFYDGPTGKRYRYESRLKLPKMLKDMLFNLCEYTAWDAEKIKHFEVVGYIQSASIIEFLTMDHPKGFICRLSRSRSFKIGHDINTFPKTLEVLAMSLMMKREINYTANFRHRFSRKSALPHSYRVYADAMISSVVTL
ncbi:hypothetical protein G6F43_000131 [Rhizopus delemar]|nr:hypothetical protein G6F43_000131 [Rhizopus delemar]